MIKWIGTKGGRPIVGFGLEERNLEMLRKGNPIHVLGEEMGLSFDVLIYYGKDMDKLMAMAKPLIHDKTIVHDERERKKQ